MTHHNHENYRKIRVRYAQNVTHTVTYTHTYIYIYIISYIYSYFLHIYIYIHNTIYVRACALYMCVWINYIGICHITKLWADDGLGKFDLLFQCGRQTVYGCNLFGQDLSGCELMSEKVLAAPRSSGDYLKRQEANGNHRAFSRAFGGNHKPLTTGGCLFD